MTARVNTALLANLFFPLKRSSESVSLSAILRELELRNRKKIQPINLTLISSAESDRNLSS